MITDAVRDHLSARPRDTLVSYAGARPRSAIADVQALLPRRRFTGRLLQ